MNCDASGFDPVRVRVSIAKCRGQPYSVVADGVTVPGRRKQPWKIPPLGLGAELNPYQVGIQSSCLLTISWSTEKNAKSISFPLHWGPFYVGHQRNHV